MTPHSAHTSGTAAPHYRAIPRRRRSRPLRPRDQVFGRTAAGSSFLHRLPAGVKVAALAAVLLVVLVARELVVSAAAVGGVVLLAGIARIRAGLLLSLLRRVWILLVAVLVVQLLLNDPATAAEVMTRVLAGLLAAHLMVLTTSTQELLTVFGVLVSPLGWVGLAPGKIMLAALVMLRAIPYLADQFHLAQQQARARGLERNIRARVVPVLLAAAAYARDTGRALAARGIEQID